MMNQQDSHHASSAIQHMAEMIQRVWCQLASDMNCPSVMFKPKLSQDGNQWCALYGENLQDGVAGFGDTPAAAMAAFDVAWYKQKNQGIKIQTKNQKGHISSNLAQS